MKCPITPASVSRARSEVPISRDEHTRGTGHAKWLTVIASMTADGSCALSQKQSHRGGVKGYWHGGSNGGFKGVV